MMIGIKGCSHSGAVKWAQFERTQANGKPIVRIRTNSEVISFSEENFIAMFGQLFAEDPNYMPRHGKEAGNE